LSVLVSSKARPLASTAEFTYQQCIACGAVGFASILQMNWRKCAAIAPLAGNYCGVALQANWHSLRFQ
jgi:hypothetical protein